ncbi:UDP-N-acetylmuramoyl-tripeptide--D-alanyl-D-alanine ligase [Pseudoalteromonas aurantia]|uniref:UDP-N-acetylmuramoyl-tripeptide--D-alanyl-D-alanine ligase n=1 Tax=Pseudoalteromonas aurantia TaxID=43654 RepID=A0A5S3VCY3_9GAMM|nr:UDP-N-acetylmuramoyl-tripeptide--D-alanyl-D-alanine ligase [Pseudoalteromonas aurantia]TMO67120.1 UDP-N-acetylmuramoyl-tripeptide--D-alanyl-D-alanine ligase [Pseudoalteromonas aurantia]TMO70021.1 UDP-N-acetylmuramoyl-tripeptide--D-alanyl-D-alanine ligase [Pseudoalteromonas aurantia]
MIKVDFTWLADALNTSFNGESKLVGNINTDTRTITTNEVFLALKGPNFDGHKFVQQAQEKGAIAAIVETEVDCDIPQFVVEDTRLALGAIGKAIMAQVAPKTIAITGSVGKTTVKEMCAVVLARRGHVLATNGNFNNDIGVPLTLMRLEEHHEYAVIELGANHIGEIAYTAALTQPDVAVVCNVAPAHIEGFGSIEGVGQAKGEIFSGLKASGVAVINSDSEFAGMWQSGLGDKSQVRFSLTEKLDIWVENVVLDHMAYASFELCTENERVSVTLPLPGEHNVMNTLICAALTTQLGASLQDVAKGVSQMNAPKGRVNLIKVHESLTVVDDTYNANVRSVKAAIDLLTKMPGHHIFALGDMGELGEQAREYHEEVGEYAREKGIDELFTLGVLSRYASDVFEQSGQHFSTREHLLEAVKLSLSKQLGHCTVVVKGSRSSRMELLVADLVDSGRKTGTDGASVC